MAAATEMDLGVNLGPLPLQNPVMPASGTFGYGPEWSQLLDVSALGAVVTKGLSLKPQAGNPPPRIVETASGMLNAVGLQNIGVEAFIQKQLPWLEQLGRPVIVNFFGHTPEDYVAVAQRLNACEAVSALEMNISCPNVRQGGMVFGTDPRQAEAVVAAVRSQVTKPLIVKLTPNVTDITCLGQAVVAAGADILCCCNTFTGMAVDTASRRPRLANTIGGLSGPAIKPLALRLVYQLARSVKVPIIGVGGIRSAEDALEFILAGASAVQLGTANFVQPQAMLETISGLQDYCRRHQSRLRDLVGALEA